MAIFIFSRLRVERQSLRKLGLHGVIEPLADCDYCFYITNFISNICSRFFLLVVFRLLLSRYMLSNILLSLNLFGKGSNLNAKQVTF